MLIDILQAIQNRLDSQTVDGKTSVSLVGGGADDGMFSRLWDQDD